VKLSIKNYEKKEKFSFIGSILKELRNNKNITLEQFSSKVDINFLTTRSYEANNKTPSLLNLIKIASFFQVSIDFLLLENKTFYTRSILFLSLTEKIDKMDQVKRFQIESTAKSLIPKEADIENIEIKTDSLKIVLTNNIHENIKSLRKEKGLTQKNIAELLNIDNSVVAYYEKKSIPPFDKLLKLSEYFNLSMHAIATGQKLNFNIENKGLQNTIHKADKLLPLRDKDFLTHLMQKIINDSNS
jgi:transcriptional regulator with XRE-family HTH domain